MVVHVETQAGANEILPTVDLCFVGCLAKLQVQPYAVQKGGFSARAVRTGVVFFQRLPPGGVILAGKYRLCLISE